MERLRASLAANTNARDGRQPVRGERKPARGASKRGGAGARTHTRKKTAARSHRHAA